MGRPLRGAQRMNQWLNQVYRQGRVVARTGARGWSVGVDARETSSSSTTIRQPRTRSATHTRAKPRNRFTSDDNENANPVPKLP